MKVRLERRPGDDREPAPKTGAMLIDFDNFLPPTLGMDASLARHQILRCIELMLELTPQLEHIDVRLYGGWRTGGVLSRRGSAAAALLRGTDPFPVTLPTGRLLRGQLNLAFGLVGAQAPQFDDTYRVRGSVPRLRLSAEPVPEACASAHHEACPARILKQFTRSGRRVCPVEDCSVTAESAFTVAEQKMVDTLVACDLIELSTPAWEKTQIALVSGDTDFVPPLIYASGRSAARFHLLAPTRNWHPDTAKLLQGFGIAVSELEAQDGTQRLTG